MRNVSSWAVVLQSKTLTPKLEEKEEEKKEEVRWAVDGAVGRLPACLACTQVWVRSQDGINLVW